MKISRNIILCLLYILLLSVLAESEEICFRGINKIEIYHDDPQEIVVSNDGQYVVVVGEQLVQIYATENGEVSFEIKSRKNFLRYDCSLGVSISPDNRYLANVDLSELTDRNNLQIWDLKHGMLIRNLRTKHLHNVTFSDDSKYVCCASDSVVTVYDTRTGEQTQLLRHNFPYLRDCAGVSAVAFSYDNQHLASVFLNSIKIWDLTLGRERGMIFDSSDFFNPAREMLFSPNEEYLVGSYYGSIKVFDIRDGRCQLEVPCQKSTSITFSKSGKYILSGCGNYPTIINFTTGQKQFLPPNCFDASSFDGGPPFSDVTFSSNGQFCAVRTKRDNIYVFEVVDDSHGLFSSRKSYGPSKLNTGSVYGRITDHDTGEPLDHAKVSISAINFSATTDSYGYYEICNVPAGKYEMKISIPDHQGMTVQNMQVGAGKVHRLEPQLRWETVELGDVVIRCADYKNIGPQIIIYEPSRAIGDTIVISGDSATVQGQIVCGFPEEIRAFIGVERLSLSPTGEFRARIGILPEINEVFIFAWEPWRRASYERLFLLGRSVERTQLSPSIPVNLIQDGFVDVDLDIPTSRNKNPTAISVILGVERYRTMPAVSFAKRDAAVFKEYAVKVLGVPDSKNNLYYRTDDEVTRGEFEKLFTENGWLARRVEPATDVYIYYAGHGAPDLKEKLPYLIPYDGDANYPTQTGFSLARLYEQLAKLNVRSVTVFLDACFSGATRENQMLLADARPVAITIENPVLLSDKMIVFTASSGEQISSGYPEKKHGLFTYFLLKGLRGDADMNKDKTITAAELEEYLIANVKRTAGHLDREQTPQVMGKDKQRVLVKY